MWNFEKANELLKKEGRTKEWFAKQCGVTLDTLYHFLAGRRKPSLPVLKLMAMALNCDESDLDPSLKKTAANG